MRLIGTSLTCLLTAGLLAAAGTGIAHAAEPPDYSAWQGLLGKYYDPARGMSYKALKQSDKATLDQLRQKLATVDVAALPRNDQLAYWINLYNISTLAVVVDSYPVDSIRDLSTDPIVRLNVFKKPSVKTKAGAMSLNDVENTRIREGFKDPRIHFAINCAAQSCPPIRIEPYQGAKINDQLDDQVRKFLNGPHGIRLAKSGGELVVHTTKIMDWFGDDFNKWGGGPIAFSKRYVSSDKRKQMDTAGNQIDLEFEDYDWKLNDASK
jgi:hypothetical protein